MFTTYIIEGPAGIYCLPGLTPLLVEVTCIVTGVAVWKANGKIYTLIDLTNEIHKYIVILLHQNNELD